jgi:hypothetical protein
MPYQISWMIDKRLVYQRCYGELTMDELRENNQEFVRDYLRQGTPLVHTIVDLTGVTNFPKNLTQYGQAFKRDAEDVARLGWTVVVGANPIFRFFGTVVTNLWRQARFRMFDTLQEAYTFLGQQDNTLDMSQVEREKAASSPPPAQTS